MSDPRDQLQADLADRHVLERELGRGGMATVYLARDLKHDRPVALKVLQPELAAVIGVKRFLHEIKVTASLQHPHILPLFDSGEANGQVFYVMPYVEGESLGARLVRERQLPIAEAVRIAREVARALGSRRPRKRSGPGGLRGARERRSQPAGGIRIGAGPASTSQLGQ